MISTRDLSGLPDLSGFEKLTQSLAALDAVLSPDWASRYYSFDAHWADGEKLASARNGSGDQWFAILSPAGTALHGLVHESPSYQPDQPKPWVFRELPAVFHENLLHEPAADAENSTFCLWRLTSDAAWQTGARGPDEDTAVDDGSAGLLGLLGGNPQDYVDFAEAYYERRLDLADVQAIYAHTPLTEALARRINPEVDAEQLGGDLQQIGYPMSGLDA